MKEKMSKKTDVRAWVIVAFIATVILVMIWYASGNNHSAYDDPIYKRQLEAEKILRDANAIPVRIVK
jgi:hypothetical protein